MQQPNAAKGPLPNGLEKLVPPASGSARGRSLHFLQLFAVRDACQEGISPAQWPSRRRKRRCRGEASLRKRRREGWG